MNQPCIPHPDPPTHTPPSLPFLIQSGFPGVSVVKNPPAMQEAWRLGFNSWVGKIPLEEEMATHFSNLAQKIPWTQSMGSQKSWTQPSD